MQVLCSMPGKLGDILWALPTCRALAEAAEAPVDLVLSQQYGDASLRKLIEGADYIHATYADPLWSVQDTAPLSPARPREMLRPQLSGNVPYDKTIHLGYTSWPLSLLPADIYVRATANWGSPLPSIDLDTPWLQQPEWSELEENTGDFDQSLYTPWGKEARPHVHIGWSEEWIELKAGLIYALVGRLPARDFRVITHMDSRLQTEWLMHFPGDTDSITEGFANLSWYAGDWILTAHALANSKLFVGCLSSQWVLANALGIPTVIVEPAVARHNPIFFYNHPRNTLLLGNDHKPTFDARHLVDKVRETLHG